MSIWTNWQADLLSSASLPNTADNRRFLSDWHNNAESNCRNNPVDLTHKEPGSTRCASTPLVGKEYQAYTSSAWARTAWNSEIHSGSFPHLLAALKSGNPYGVSDPGAVATDLASWPSTKFGNAYLKETATAGGGGPGPGLSGDTQALRGWADLQRSFNRNLPAALRMSERTRIRALRELGRVRKVGR